MSKWQGTPVPNSGYVENVYFNTNLSVEEVDNLIKDLNYYILDGQPPAYSLLASEDFNDTISISNDNGNIAILRFNRSTYAMDIFWTNYEYTDGLTGWRDAAKGSISVNNSVTNTGGVFDVGLENYKLSSLFSITPFEQGQDKWVRVKKSTLEGIGDAIREKEGSSELIPTAEMEARIRAISSGGITPTGTYQVTDNGEYDITEYAKVNVNVASSGSEGNTLKKLLDYTKSCYYMFYNNSTENQNIIDTTEYISYSDTENVTNMAYMFYGNKNLTTVGLMNTSKVTDMSNMFRECKSLANIPQLNTSKVTYMSYMISGCTALTTIPQLNTSNVTTMQNMFHNCFSLTTIPQLNTSNVNNMSYMFNSCNALTKIDITYYKISSTSNSSRWCYNLYSLKAVIIRGFGTSYALNSNAFNNCYHLTGTVNTTYNPNGDKDCYIYAPKNMCDTLKSATNWSTYADQIRALEDYTVDGTTTGELDESKVNA